MLRFFAGLCLAFFAASAAFAGAAPVEDFYRGKVITLIVGNSPGGGFDVIGRLLARHMGQYIPGNPMIVVQNMPGAGTLVATNYLYNVAPKDGSQFGLIERNMPLLGLMGGNPNVRYDPRKFTWLGSSSDFSDDGYILIVRKDSPVKSIDEVRGPGGKLLVLGGTGDGASSADVPKILRDTLHLNMRLILGYRDSAAVNLALESGEVSGRMVELSSIRSTHPQWLAPDGDYRVLAMYARAKRHPDFPDVPIARELASDDAARALIEFTETPLLSMAWPFTAPPGIPEDRAAALQSAFMAAHRDREFLADAATLKVPIDPVSAADVGRAIDRLAGSSPDLFDYMRKLMTAASRG